MEENKEKKASKENKTTKTSKTKEFLTKMKTVIKEKEVIIALIIALVLGLAIGLIAMYFLHPISLAKFKYGSEAVASFDGKSITSKELYDAMKKHYSIELVLEQIDSEILNSKYTLDEEMKQEVSDNTDSFLTYYESYYGYTEAEIYTAFGFKDRAELEEYLKLDYERTLYLYDYIESKLEAGAVQKYYDENKSTLAKYDSKHILVKISDTVTDEAALAIANEIITKLNDGKTYDEIVSEYGDTVTAEDLGYYSSTGGLETSYFDALAAMENGTYSKEPVKTSYGYHIIFKLGTKDSLEDVKHDILDVLSKDMKSADSNFAYNALINMRKEANINFYDEELAKKYEDYCTKYASTATK